MKKYTARINLLGNAMDLYDVKSAVEKTMLRSHTPLTLRFGAIGKDDKGDVLLEIATDVNKDFLITLLKNLGSIYPLKFEQLSWGWILSSQVTQTKPGKRILSFNDDPYATIEPQNDPVREYNCVTLFKIKFIASLVIIIFFVFSIVFRFILSSVARSYLNQHDDFTSTIFMLVWIIILSFGIPLFPWRYVSSFRCTPETLAIKYFLRSSWISLPWGQIQGLSVNYNGLTLQTNNREIKIVMGPDWSKETQKTLIKSILTNARLIHIGGGPTGSMYNRSDAFL
jgi:hypothetical protein